MVFLIMLMLASFPKVIGGAVDGSSPIIISSRTDGEAIIAHGYVYVKSLKKPFILRVPLNESEKTWGHVFDLEGYGVLYSSTTLHDRSLIAVGYTYTQENGFDIIALRVNREGKVSWAYALGGKGDDLGVDILLVDNEALIVGYSRSFGFGSFNDWNIIMLKIDLSGNLVRSWVLGTEAYDDFVKGVYRTSNGELLLFGETWSYNVSMSDVLLVKMNSDMEVLWSKSMGGSSREEALATVESGEGGFIVVGVSESLPFGGTDGFFLKVDEGGWLEYVRGVGWDGGDGLIDVYSLGDSYILLGYTSLRREETDLLFLEVSREGNLNSTYVLVREGFESPHSIKLLNNRLIVTSRFSDDGEGGLTVTKISKGWNSATATLISKGKPSHTDLGLLKVSSINSHIAQTSWSCRTQNLFKRPVEVSSSPITTESLLIPFNTQNVKVEVGEYIEKTDWLGIIMDILESNVPLLIMAIPFLTLLLAFALLKLHKLFMKSSVKKAQS